MYLSTILILLAGLTSFAAAAGLLLCHNATSSNPPSSPRDATAPDRNPAVPWRLPSVFVH